MICEIKCPEDRNTAGTTPQRLRTSESILCEARGFGKNSDVRRELKFEGPLWTGIVDDPNLDDPKKQSKIWPASG
jgi:hypothetical protein